MRIKIPWRRLPWWLRPWPVVRALQKAQREQLRIIDGQAGVANRLKDECRNLRAQVRALEAWRNGQPTGATGKPEFVLFGVPRGTMGKRLYASKDLRAARFGQAEHEGASMWTLDVDGMDHMLIIDEDDYANCLYRMSVIWQNRERDEREKKRVLEPGTGARPHGRQSRQAIGDIVVEVSEEPDRMRIAPLGTGPDDPGWVEVGVTEGGVGMFLTPPVPLKVTERTRGGLPCPNCDAPESYIPGDRCYSCGYGTCPAGIRVISTVIVDGLLTHADGTVCEHE